MSYEQLQYDLRVAIAALDLLRKEKCWCDPVISTSGIVHTSACRLAGYVTEQSQRGTA